MYLIQMQFCDVCRCLCKADPITRDLYLNEIIWAQAWCEVNKRASCSRLSGAVHSRGAEISLGSELVEQLPQAMCV